MSESIGPVSYREGEEHLFLGQEVTRKKNHSEQVAVEIDAEVKRVLLECYEHARQALEDHRGEMEALADALLKYEVLTGAEVAAVLRGDTVEALRKKNLANERAKAATADRPAPDAAGGESEGEDVDDLETKGRFAY